jgi:uncharacterized membrane protein
VNDSADRPGDSSDKRDTSGKPGGNPLWDGVAAFAIVLALVGAFFRPFIFIPLGAILILIASKQSSNQRITLPGVVVISVCAVFGAAWAALSGDPLY